jgi:hypothetical protein
MTMGDDVKTFDSIVLEITSGLSGDAEADLAYLREQAERHKHHEMGTEIVRACGRLAYDLLPDEQKAELEQTIRNTSSGTAAILEEVRFNIYKKDFDKALQMIEGLVDLIEKEELFQDDRVSQYHVFDEYFEEVLYRYLYKPEKELRHAQFPYTEIYLLYGSLLVESEDYTAARQALKKGLRWNPVSFSLQVEYIETYKLTGDLEQFCELSKEAFKIAFRSPDVARCYRNLAYYFAEKKLYSEAIACNLMSLQFENESPQARSELYYINSITEGTVEAPTYEQIKKYADQYGFPMGADEEIIRLAYAYGKHCLAEERPKVARYFLSIAYDLTDDQTVKSLLETLPQPD